MSKYSLALLPLVASALTLEESHSHIRQEVSHYTSQSERGVGQDLCDKYTCCDGTTSSCDISSMPRDETTLYLPGGASRCIFDSSTPYAAQVIPGDADKLMVFFQGGGACWDEASTKAGFCTTDSSPSSLNGIFDRKNGRNAQASYTVVQMLYCSGDVFGGNVTQTYTDKNGGPVVQVGLTNVQLTLDWIKAQQASGQLASTLTDLVVAGCSAGSLGAQLWGNQVIEQLSWKTATIMPDSYAGVFAPGVEGPLIKNYGFCSSGFLNADNYAKCEAESLLMTDIDHQFMSDRPDVGYAFIQSKTDIVQQSFYVATAASMDVPAEITPAQFYDDVNTIFGGYNKYPNFVTYLVDGDQHCFTPSSVYYTADAAGPKDDGAGSSGPMMSEWVGDSIPLQQGETISTVCDGDVQQQDTWSAAYRSSGSESKTRVGKMLAGAGAAGKEDTTYCSSSVTPKTFTEEY